MAKYQIYGDGTVFAVNDEAAPALNHLAAAMPRIFTRALGHAGWWVRGQLRSGIASEAPGGKRWPPLNAISQTRILDSIRGRFKAYKRPRGGRTGRWILPKLRFSRLTAGGAGATRGPTQGGRGLYNAIRYSLNRGRMSVSIGWISPSAARLGKLFQSDFERPVTARMRRFFNVAGLKLGRGPIHHPAREVMKPTFEAIKGQIPAEIIGDMEAYMEKTLVGYQKGDIWAQADRFASYRRRAAA